MTEEFVSKQQHSIAVILSDKREIKWIGFLPIKINTKSSTLESSWLNLELCFNLFIFGINAALLREGS